MPFLLFLFRSLEDRIKPRPCRSLAMNAIGAVAVPER
jgi:hypothetical protein